MHGQPDSRVPTAVLLHVALTGGGGARSKPPPPPAGGGDAAVPPQRPLVHVPDTQKLLSLLTQVQPLGRVPTTCDKHMSGGGGGGRGGGGGGDGLVFGGGGG